MTVYTGIDESQAKHDGVFMNEAGAQLAVLTIPHTLEGFQQLATASQILGLSLCWLLQRLTTIRISPYSAKTSPEGLSVLDEVFIYKGFQQSFPR